MYFTVWQSIRDSNTKSQNALDFLTRYNVGCGVFLWANNKDWSIIKQCLQFEAVSYFHEDIQKFVLCYDTWFNNVPHVSNTWLTLKFFCYRIVKKYSSLSCVAKGSHFLDYLIYICVLGRPNVLQWLCQKRARIFCYG